MQFAACIKTVKLDPNKTIITLEVAPDETGNIDGLQTLMSQVVSVNVEPAQTHFEFAESI